MRKVGVTTFIRRKLARGVTPLLIAVLAWTLKEFKEFEFLFDKVSWKAGACALRDLSIFFGSRLWLDREYVVHVASLISYQSKSEVYYPDFSTLWHEKIWRLIRRRMALTFYIYLMFRKNGIINQFSDISYCETQKVKYTRNIHRRFLRFFFVWKAMSIRFQKTKARTAAIINCAKRQFDWPMYNWPFRVKSKCSRLPELHTIVYKL